MCLALPGQIVSIYEEDGLLMANVDFSGMQKKICLIYTPNAKIDDFVIVHVGFAINILNIEQAQNTLALLQGISDEIRI